MPGKNNGGNDGKRSGIKEKLIYAFAVAAAFVLSIPRRLKTRRLKRKYNAAVRRAELRAASGGRVPHPVGLLFGTVGFTLFMGLCLFAGAYMKEQDAKNYYIAPTLNGSRVTADAADIIAAKSLVEDEISLITGRDHHIGITYSAELAEGEPPEPIGSDELYVMFRDSEGSAGSAVVGYEYYIDGALAGIAESEQAFKDAYAEAQEIMLSEQIEHDPSVSRIKVSSKLSARRMKVLPSAIKTEDELIAAINKDDSSVWNSAMYKYTVFRRYRENKLIPFTEETEYSWDYFEGFSQKTQDGTMGIESYTYEVEYDGAAQIGKKLVKTETLCAMQPTKYVVGTRMPPPSIPTGTFEIPLDIKYRISSHYGDYRPEFDGDAFHFGIDLVCDEGTPVFASDGGKVSYVGQTPSYGIMVIIDHYNNLQTAYAHLSESLVEVGDDVYQGQNIALSGNTGTTTAPHLHFEIRLLNTPVDPETYLEF